VIPANAERAAALLYRFDFTPRAPGAAKDKVDIHFVLERPGRIATPARPAAGLQGTHAVVRHRAGFRARCRPVLEAAPRGKAPGRLCGLAGQWQLRPDPADALAPKGTARPHEATLRIRGVKDAKGATSQLEIELLAEAACLRPGCPPITASATTATC
jgi:hypothetical protein